MKQARPGHLPGAWSVALLGLAGVGATSPVLAQSVIVPDATLGAEATQVNLTGTTYRIGGGAVRGGNLFHSFEGFSIGPSDSALFVTGPNTANVFGRITGSSPSTIFGTLGTLTPEGTGPSAANLYLINPNGIVFGEGASLSLGGAFTATTATEVVFGEAGQFSATDPTLPSPLLTVDPSAFLFGSAPASIQVNQAQLMPGVGADLILVGGDLQLSGSTLTTTDGGNVVLEAAGEVQLAAQSEIASRLDMAVGNNLNGGAIHIAAADVTLTEGSQIITTGAGGGVGGTITLTVANTIRLDGVGPDGFPSGIRSRVEPETIGNAGDVIITTTDLEVTGGAVIDTANLGQGDAGNIVIEASGNVLLSGTNPRDETYPGGIYSSIGSDGQGQGGSVTVTAANLTMTGGAVIFTAVNGVGTAGDIVIAVEDTVHLERTGDFFGNGIYSSVDTNITDATSTSGDIFLTATDVALVNGFVIDASLLSGSGTAGTIHLAVADTLYLGGIGPDLVPSQITSRVDAGTIGNAGDVIITTTDLVVTEGAVIDTATLGEGDAGNIVITARGNVLLSGTNPRYPGGIYSSIGPNGQGDGGGITLTAANLRIAGGAVIFTAVQGAGTAGDIVIDVDGTVRLEGTAETFGSGIYSSVDTAAGGTSGTIFLTATDVALVGGSVIDTSLFSGTGQAGRIVLEVANTLQISDINPNTGQPSGIFSFTAGGPLGDGDSVQADASIQITAGTVEMTDGAEISTVNLFQGNGGDISIIVDGVLQLVDGTIATNVADGAGGDITLTASGLILQGDSDIQTSVASGMGGGGNITLTGDFIIALDDSDILAFAADGAGGDITIVTPAFFVEAFTLTAASSTPALLENNGQVDINASGAVNGTITIPETTLVTPDFTSLEGDQVPTDQLVAGSCIAQAPTGQGQFVVTGREGLPGQPGDSPPAVFATGTIRGLEPTASPSPSQTLAEPSAVFRLSDGRLVLSQPCGS